MLKKLEGWLKAHSHYGIDAEWGPLVISWVSESNTPLLIGLVTH